MKQLQPTSFPPNPECSVSDMTLAQIGVLSATSRRPLAVARIHARGWPGRCQKRDFHRNYQGQTALVVERLTSGRPQGIRSFHRSVALCSAS
jgi:hypothetical protein